MNSTKQKIVFGQLIALDWHQQWPPAIWNAIHAIANRNAIHIQDITTSKQLWFYCKLRPGHWDTIRRGLRAIGYALPWPDGDYPGE